MARSMLDDCSMYAALDPQRMHERIGALPRQCAAAWSLLSERTVLADYGRAQQVVVLGMGGSAIGGALLAGLVAGECAVPILSVGDYELPAWVGPGALVVASSHSGNTEETLAACAQALERGCRLVAVTTGGKLAALAERHGLPLLRFADDGPPRAALGYSFTLLLGLLCRLGLLRDYGPDLEEAVAVMTAWQQELTADVPTERNLAKRLALWLHRRLPAIYGAGFLAAVARRWKGQCNENSKSWAFWEELPELNHNAVVGYRLPKGIRKRARVLLLRSSLDHPRVQTRWQATQALLEEENVAVESVWARGEGRLAHMLSLVHLGDYVSFYLAMLNGVDPWPVEPIQRLKAWMGDMDATDYTDRSSA